MKANTQNKVTKHRYPKHRRSERREDAAREWRVANLAWLLDFAFSPLDKSYRAEESSGVHAGSSINDIEHFIRRAGPLAWSKVGQSPDLTEIEWLQRAAQYCLLATINGYRWAIPFADLVALDKNFQIMVEPGYLAPLYVASSLKPLFLLALSTALGGREKDRLMRCEEPECPVIIIRRKTGKFCRLHGSGKERARRRREALRGELSLIERRQRRNRYHTAAVEKTKGKDAAAKVATRPPSGNDLLLDALKSADRANRLSAREVASQEVPIRITALLGATPSEKKRKPGVEDTFVTRSGALLRELIRQRDHSSAPPLDTGKVIKVRLGTSSHAQPNYGTGPCDRCGRLLEDHVYRSGSSCIV